MAHSKSSADSTTALQPSVVLCAYGESLMRGARVALFDDCTSGLGDRVAQLSGRRVHVYDRDRDRVATQLAAMPRGGASRVSYALLEQNGDVADAAFDLVVVADLGALGSPKGVLAAAEAMLSRRGALLVATRNVGRDGDGVSYYDLYDLLSTAYREVRMLGQAPFVGYTVADFSTEEEPAVTIDTTLMDGAEDAAWFVAVASNERVELDPYTLVQLPLEQAAPWLLPGGDPGVDTAALAQARLESSVARTELEKLRDKRRREARLAQEREERVKALSARVAELEQQLARGRRDAQQQRQGASAEQLEQLRAEHQRALEEAEEAFQSDLDQALERVADLDDELEVALGAQQAADAARRAAEQQRDAAKQQLDGVRAERDAAREQRDAAKAEREAAEAERDAAKAEREAAEAEREAVEAERGDVAAPEPIAPAAFDEAGYRFQIDELKTSLREARGEGQRWRAEAERATAEQQAALEDQLAEAETAEVGAGDAELERAHGEDVDRYERRLKERGRTVAELSDQLRGAQQAGRELVRELERQRRSAANGSAEAPPSDDGSRLEGLARRCSRYEADLQAARWRIAQLEAQVDDGASADVDAALSEALQQAQAELAQLRRAKPG
jgi:hypothetical protein